MGTGPQDSTTSVFLRGCCSPAPARFFPPWNASISARAPVADSHGTERQSPGSSRGNRSVRLARNADDYRLHFPFFICVLSFAHPYSTPNCDPDKLRNEKYQMKNGK